MAEATYTEIVTFSLLPGGGGGAKMLVGRFTISDGETISTDFRDIFGMLIQEIGDVAATYNVGAAASHPAAGQITLSTGEIDTYGAVADQVYYVMIIGIQ